MNTNVMWSRLCLTLLLSSIPLHGARAGSGFETQLSTVIRLYEGLEYEQALAHLERTWSFSRGSADAARLFLYKGILNAELGRWRQARTAFATAIKHQPDVRLPLAVSPKLVSEFEAQRLHWKATSAPTPSANKLDNATVISQDTAEPPADSSGSQDGILLPLPTADTRKEAASPVRWADSRILVPAVTGSVLLVAGGISWGMARVEYSRLERRDPRLDSREQLERSASRGRTLQTVGFCLGGAGLLGLGIAVGLHQQRSSVTALSVGVGSTGVSASLSGRWP